MAPSMLSISLRAGCVQNSHWALRFRTLSRLRVRMAVYMWGRPKAWSRWLLLNLLVSHENPSLFVGNQPNGIDRRDPIYRVPRVGRRGAHVGTLGCWPFPSPPVGRDNAD